jgi:hypothetical protein
LSTKARKKLKVEINKGVTHYFNFIISTSSSDQKKTIAKRVQGSHEDSKLIAIITTMIRRTGGQV